MALINFLEIYNVDRHLIINNKYKNLRLLKVDKLPAPKEMGGNGGWRYWEYEIPFGLNYLPAIHCNNPQYYVTTEALAGKMIVRVQAHDSVSMTKEQAHDAVTLYVFTEQVEQDTSGAGLFIWDPETRQLVFNSKSVYMRVVGSHIKSEISTNDAAGLSSTMPETSFPCGKVAALMFSMHEFQKCTPQVVMQSSLKINWLNNNTLKATWLADYGSPNNGDINIPTGVLRATCILFINVTGY